MHMTYTVELQQAAVGYGEKTVVRDITLHVRSGEILALIGPNGGGKSTILKSIAGQIRALGGTISVMGKDPGKADPAEMAKIMAQVMTGRIRPEQMTGFDVAAPAGWDATPRRTGESRRKRWPFWRRRICRRFSLKR